jgi:serine/threonine protein kinase
LRGEGWVASLDRLAQGGATLHEVFSQYKIHYHNTQRHRTERLHGKMFSSLMQSFHGKSNFHRRPHWMAPELFKGEKLRFSCDVYSFAMTMYEVWFKLWGIWRIAHDPVSSLLMRFLLVPCRQISCANS